MSMLKNDTYVWFDGEMKKFGECSVSLTTHALHYATSIFEGCRAYNGKIFKNKEHCQRLINSGKMVDVQVPYSVEELMQASNEVLKANNLTDAYVRPVAWKGDQSLGVESDGCKTHVAIMAWYWGNYFGDDKVNGGLKLTHADWVRPDPRSCAVQAKVAGNYYLGAVMHNKANKGHYDDVLLVDWRGYVAECTSCNVFFIKDKKVYTPIADCFLNGITRQTIINEVCKKMGLEVEETRIKPEYLGDFDEAFISGTAAEVMPIGKIYDTFTYKPDLCLKIRDEYLKLVKGL